MPPEKYRDKGDEVISNDEYLEIQSGKTRSDTLDQVGNDFDFDNSRGINNEPSSTDYKKA